MKLRVVATLAVSALLSCAGHDAQQGGDQGSSGQPGASSGGASSGAPNGSSGGTGSGVASSSGGTPATFDALAFAVVGDTRPPIPDDVAGYPTDVVTKIYAGIAAHTPQPAFVVGTGDYQYSSYQGPDAQLDLYLGARKQFAGPFYPAMGNHECTGATASNCGTGTHDGATKQYTGFLTRMLGPISQTGPYYAIAANAKDGSWTAKFLFLAANAWTAEQGTWLDGEMAKPTTYTFVVRHEPGYETQAPGVAPSEQIMAKHPYTLAIVGHTHTFRKSAAREVIVGNGGAPIKGGVSYGWAFVERRADGAIQVQMIDYQTGQATPGLGFALKADGSPAS